jgi:predicted DNA-binding protein (MmcQ/YjbR family)
VRDELIVTGQAQRHPVLPESGWVSLVIRDPGDVDTAIALLRRSYQLIQAQAARRKAQAATIKP